MLEMEGGATFGASGVLELFLGLKVIGDAVVWIESVT